MSQPERVPYRIRIAVTGHRNPRRLPPIEHFKSVLYRVLGIGLNGEINLDPNDSIFQFYDKRSLDLIRKSEDTDIAYTVISPLAEGADRMAVRIILKSTNAKLQAVIPMVKSDYMQEFRTSESKAEFLDLISNDPRPTQMRKKPLIRTLPKPELKIERLSAYRDVGYYLVDHCDLLIGIWDGKQGRKGGTSHILDYAASVKCPRIIIRVDKREIKETVFIRERGLNAVSLEYLNRFNRNLGLSEQDHFEIRKIANNIFSKTLSGAHVDHSVINNLKEHFYPFYLKADQIAVKTQRIYFRAGRTALWMAATAVLSIGFGLVWRPFFHWAFLIELMLLAVIFVLIYNANRGRAHRNWIEHRFLAERIRIGQFFYVAGHSVTKLERHPYHGISEQEDWIARIWNEIWDRLNFKTMVDLTRGYSKENVAFIKGALIEQQKEMHIGKAQSMSTRNKRYEFGGRLIYSLALFAAAVHCVPYFVFHTKIPSILDNSLTLMALVLPAIGAMTDGLRRLMEYSRNHKRHLKMSSALATIEDKFEIVDDEKRWSDLLGEIDDLLMHEVLDWLAMRSVLELEPVT